MTPITVRPMNTGAMSLGGRPTLQSSGRKKMMVTKRNVPRASTEKARGRDTCAVRGADGFGKYTANIIALLTEAAVPRTMDCAVSKEDMDPEKTE